MLIKMEFDLKDEMQMDLLLEILPLFKKHGFRAYNSDTLRKVEPPDSPETKP